MLTNATHLTGLSLQALDGELGAVEQFYFDDETWGVRYLVVDTGGWLSGREVLISPISITHTDWPARRVHVALTKRQVEESPGIDTHLPISRRHEARFMGYYGYPHYWGGTSLWGPAFFPAGMALEPSLSAEAMDRRIQTESPDSHLRSSQAVNGYNLETHEGEIGHLKGFLVDNETWAIRYLEVATRNWWPGKRVLVAPEWIEKISWQDSKVFVGLTREAIRGCPEYLESMHIDRDYENRIYLHYGKPPYWMNEAGRKPVPDLIGV
jgi:hypothetical protein